MHKRQTIVVELLIVLIAVFMTACEKSSSDSRIPQTNQGAAAKSTPQGSPLTPFESDLRYVRNGGYTYIWLFARKDGKSLDKDDSALLKKNAPQVVDWVITDNGRRVFGGTNFDLEKGNLDLLKKRFVVEDYSAK